MARVQADAERVRGAKRCPKREVAMCAGWAEARVCIYVRFNEECVCARRARVRVRVCLCWCMCAEPAGPPAYFSGVLAWTSCVCARVRYGFMVLLSLVHE